MDTPIGSKKADLVYKNTPQRDLMLTFLPPTNKKYDDAPVYFIIPGGHLALMVAYAPEELFSSDYEFCDKFSAKVVAPMSPPTILYDGLTHNLDNELNKAFSDCDSKEERKKTSPITYVSKSCPPTLLCAGTSDYLVFANSSERLFEKLTECNISCELRLSIGGGHCFEKIHSTIEPSINMEEMQNSITDFILQYMEKNND